MSQKPQQANTSDVIKVRYEKLDALREAGRDPFVITTSDRDTLTETIKNIESRSFADSCRNTYSCHYCDMKYFCRKKEISEELK